MATIQGYPRSISRAVAAGAAATAAIGPFPGLHVGDTLIDVLQLPADGDVTTTPAVSRLSEASIDDYGVISLTTTNTTDLFVLAIWSGTD